MIIIRDEVKIRLRNTKISSRRLIFAAVITVLNLIFSLAVCFINDVLADETICIISISLVFSIMFFIYQMRARLDGKLPEKIYSSNSRLLTGLILSWAVLIGFLFIPVTYISFIFSIVILTCVCDTTGAAILSMYMLSVLALASDFSNSYFVGAILQICVGLILSAYLKKRSGMEKLFSLIIVFAMQIMLPVISLYLDKLEVSFDSIKYSFISALVSTLLVSFIPMIFEQEINKSQETAYEDFMVDNYPLVEDIRHFSYYEFTHAKRVSRLCFICAEEIGANSGLCSCAGLYYRLGKILGEPEIDNAVKTAEDNCFPQPLIDIIYEYGGLLRKPSTEESAIVHMVDAIVTKIELLDKDSMSSSWNQNMVIYQTINEISEKGMYDESGLSMNRFLKVREKLVSEDILA